MEKKPKNNFHFDCKKILRECFWEYHMSQEELLAMAQHGTEQEKSFLFRKILENSQDVLRSLNIFSADDQKKLVLQYTPPKFNHHFLEKRYKVVKYFITGQEADIPELRWHP